jgi:hypothetical protein
MGPIRHGRAATRRNLMRSPSPPLISLLVFLTASFLACAAPDAPATTEAPATQPSGEQDTPSPDAIVAGLRDQETTQGAPEAKDRNTVPASTEYPAPHPGMPQIPYHGGGVLHDLAIVTVTFPGDRYATRLQAFGDQVGSLKWWSTVHAGYGVGPATGAGHVTIASAPPAALTDADVETWLAARIGDGTLPPPTDQILYALYYPQATTITLRGAGGGAASCQVFLGFHTSIDVTFGGRSIPVAYAVINRCADDLDQLTETASHEFTEVATDPHPVDDASSGYVTLVDNAWTVLGGENADMCSGLRSVTEAGWALTRVWNNLTAAAGDQPCLPAPEGGGGLPYYNAGIVGERLVIDRGASASTEVDCYAFGALPAPMALSTQIPAQDPIKIAFDRKTCTNGDKVTMTVSVGASARHGADYHYTLYAGMGETSAHLWRGMVHVP